MRKTLIHALIACALGVALGLLTDGARAQSMEGWQRKSDVQLKFEADHAACTKQSTPLAVSLGRPGITTTQAFGQCMRVRGWVKGAP